MKLFYIMLAAVFMFGTASIYADSTRNSKMMGNEMTKDTNLMNAKMMNGKMMQGDMSQHMKDHNMKGHDKMMHGKNTKEGPGMCPVMGAPASKKYSYEYKGKTYYFCCASCIKQFKADPEKYIKKM